jgi:hypothetical protein
MRFQELETVWGDVTRSAASALFGNGWGASIKSPAVGGLSVNYTHNLVSAALLKSGMIGAALLCLYLFLLGTSFFSLVRQRPVLALALFWPFVIDIFLYASYKSLDFGLILTLIACYGLKDNNNRKDVRRSLKTYPADQPRLSSGQRADGAPAA